MSMSGMLDGRVDPRPLAMARIGVGLAGAILAFVERDDITDLANPGALLVPSFSWLPAPSVGIATALWAVWIMASAALTVGWHPRVSAGMTAGCGALALVLDQQLYSNHLLLMIVLATLLTLAPPAGPRSVAGDRVESPVPAWPSLLVMTQISSLYLWTAIAKVNGSWLGGGVLEAYVRSPLNGAGNGVLQAVAAVTIAVELLLAVGLWIPRLTRPCVLLGVGLHVGIVLSVQEFEQLLPFSLMMISTYPLFWERAGRHGCRTASGAAASRPTMGAGV